MEKIKVVLGVVLVIVGALLGLYLGGYVMFFGGLIQIFTHITPVDGLEIAAGIIRVVLASVVGWFTFAFIATIGRMLIGNK